MLLRRAYEHTAVAPVVRAQQHFTSIKLVALLCWRLACLLAPACLRLTWALRTPPACCRASLPHPAVLQLSCLPLPRSFAEPGTAP